MIIDETQFMRALKGVSAEDVKTYFPLFRDALPKHSIDTPLRLAHFFAQIGHESLSLKYKQELASGCAYEGRRDLGNVQIGDGVMFKGRGFIQVTGRANYALFSKWYYGDMKCVDNPKLLEMPKLAVASAIWFWNTRHLNKYADMDAIKTETMRINGGLNGLDDRIKRLEYCKLAFGISK